jgi:secondary thiamine-phosphate synthase enzyme
MVTLRVRTDRRTQLIDVTQLVQKAVQESGIPGGICYLYVPHTTAAVFINENADPDVARDIEATLDRLVPQVGNYRHGEGNSDAHIKSALIGASQSLLIENGRLALGRWQGVFFCEFDGPRERRLQLKIIADKA